MRERMERLDMYMKAKQLNDNQVTVLCGLSIGLLNKARLGKSDIGMGACNKILSKCQDLSRVWLLTGEGPMLKEGTLQQQAGDNNTQIAGNSNNVNNSATLDKALDEIAEQRKLVATSQGQIDRLLVIIENMTKN